MAAASTPLRCRQQVVDPARRAGYFQGGSSRRCALRSRVSHGLKDAQAGVVLGMLLIALIHFARTAPRLCGRTSNRINRERPRLGPLARFQTSQKAAKCEPQLHPDSDVAVGFRSRARLYRDRKSAPPAVFSFFFFRSISALLASRGAQSCAACLPVASCLAATCLLTQARLFFSSLDLLTLPAISGRLECRE